MVGKAKLALGLLASFLTISTVLADNTVIGTYKADPGKTPEAPATSQTLDGKDSSAKGESTPISGKIKKC